MLDVKVRIDESAQPVAVDYLHLRGRDKGKVTYGIMEWVGDEVRFLMAAAGQPRPTSFSALDTRYTLSHWKRKDE